MTQSISQKPRIVLSEADYARLANLAASAFERLPELADELQSELDRADIVAPGAVPADVVRMGSTVEFRTDNGIARSVTLVFPAEADIASSRVSVLTPIGTALIGLAAGQSIRWTTRDGREQELTVVGVEPPVFGQAPETLLS
jgi:regulator of nucleoside diphosphate kinase